MNVIKVFLNPRAGGAQGSDLRAELTKLFDASAAVDEVARGKPAPDLYLEAARRLGIAPTRCIAIEDSPVGARAALAAGMTTVGIARHPSVAHTLAHAHLVVHELSRDTLPGLPPP